MRFHHPAGRGPADYGTPAACGRALPGSATSAAFDRGALSRSTLPCCWSLTQTTNSCPFALPSWAAAFMLDPDGITRTKTLGTERMARKLADAVPGGSNQLRAAVWEFLRPMLSPRVAALHRDAFVFDEPLETTVQLASHRGESDLADLDISEDTEPAAA